MEDEKLKRIKISDIDISKMPFQHGTLPNALIERIKKFKVILFEVETATLEEAIDNFRHDMHPEREIHIWEWIANSYQDFTQRFKIEDIENKKLVYVILLKLSSGDVDKEALLHFHGPQLDAFSQYIKEYQGQQSVKTGGLKRLFVISALTIIGFVIVLFVIMRFIIFIQEDLSPVEFNPPIQQFNEEQIDETHYPIDFSFREQVRIGDSDYTFSYVRTAGNASASLSLSLENILNTQERHTFYANYNFRDDEYRKNICSGPRYSEGANLGPIGDFFREQIMKFWNENSDWPKECLGTK